MAKYIPELVLRVFVGWVDVCKWSLKPPTQPTIARDADGQWVACAETMVRGDSTWLTRGLSSMYVGCGGTETPWEQTLTTYAEAIEMLNEIEATKSTPSNQQTVAEIMSTADKVAKDVLERVMPIATSILPVERIHCTIELSRGVVVKALFKGQYIESLTVPWSQCDNDSKISTYIDRCRKYASTAPTPHYNTGMREDFFKYVSQHGVYPLGVDRCRIKEGWEGAGREGMVIGGMYNKRWVPVQWDDEEDPDWHKNDGLDFGPSSRTGVE